ncbi:hypothetical protein DV735_g343, partial [Chaetothyriales sp. CBS 134920]
MWPVQVFAGLAALLPLAVSSSRLTPPVLPLIVRNPYLSTWLGNARDVPWEKWPMFWTGQEIGFSVMASVPSERTSYPLLGRPHDSLWHDDEHYKVAFPVYKGAQYDASTTNLSYSIPLRDGHTGGSSGSDSWVSGNRGSTINWSLERTSFGVAAAPLKTWKVQRQVEQHFTEFMDRAEWGTLYFSGPADVRHEAGVSAKLRQRFSTTGTLQNQAVMFTIAHVQDPVVQFQSARGLTQMKPLWKSYLAGDQQLLAYHWLDFHKARALADSYSAQLAKDAYKSGAEDYVDIVALSARQVMGATSFSGTPDDPILFLKEISSNGNFQTIDVIFPAFPFFIYTNPRWLAYLLEPLIEHMLSGQYPNKYAMHDLGAHFPNATGHPDGRDEYMPVEECGNILIMGLALVNSLKAEASSSQAGNWRPLGKLPLPDPSKSGTFSLVVGSQDDTPFIDEVWNSGPQSQKQARKWVERSYTLWKQWTSYLVEFSLRPANQLSTDDFAGWLPLQTNLALKGIIGIKAMAGLAQVVGLDADVKAYDNISQVYVAKWEEYGISRDKTHAKVAYDWYGSWTTTYNLYADSLLCFHLGSKSAVGSTLQSDWYYAVRQKYGLPLDSRHLYTKTDWEFFAMAVAAPRVRAEILQSVAKWVNETVTDRPLTDLHKTEEQGGFPGPNFFARPVVGGHFAFLTLGQACGGRAEKGLEFLDDSVVDRIGLALHVEGALERERMEEGLPSEDAARSTTDRRLSQPSPSRSELSADRADSYFEIHEEMSQRSLDKLHAVSLSQHQQQPANIGPSPLLALVRPSSGHENSQLSVSMSSLISLDEKDESQQQEQQSSSHNTNTKEDEDEDEKILPFPRIDEEGQEDKSRRAALMAERAEILRTRLQLAYYKVTTNQITLPAPARAIVPWKQHRAWQQPY